MNEGRRDVSESESEGADDSIVLKYKWPFEGGNARVV